MKSFLFFTLMTFAMRAQQVPDTLFSVHIKNPAYTAGAGPVIRIDEAHHNFHTATNRFRPFALLLERDGYRVERGKSKFNKKSLQGQKILVISNALKERNESDWSLPNPSAFTDEEIKQVTGWVEEGGSLFLISDHMPFPGFNEKLAAAFGFTFYNGFAFDTTKQGGPDLFAIRNGRLALNAVTNGLDSIWTFTGQAFDIPSNARAILTLDQNFKIWMPRVAWQFDKDTRKIEGRGKVQGAFMDYGKGRVVVFGEAAMFSAQIAGAGNKMGFNHPEAKSNAEFLLRLIHWLDK